MDELSALRMQQIANSVVASLPTNEQIMASTQAAMAQLMKAVLVSLHGLFGGFGFVHPLQQDHNTSLPPFLPPGVGGASSPMPDTAST